ncbi:MAG TPA: PD-(D/E)XK nuclease family protein [Clostridiales bacterium]|nr:PD-(D/E)XK nuclease family protein [Clostridiales bacterium]
MSCHLITGRQNTDRTAALYRALFQALGQKGRQVYLVLPEQATFQHELKIAATRAGRHLLNLKITSFKRLADDHVNRAALDKLGRNLLIYGLLREKRDQLSALKPADISGGFVEDMGDVLKEVSMNGLSANFLLEQATALDSLANAGDLPGKLRDIALLKAVMEERGVPDESGLLFSFAEIIREEKLFADAVFCFDEFFDFTAAEYAVIEALFASSVDLHFAFLYDSCDPTAPVFAKTAAAVSHLLRLACDHGVAATVTPLVGEEDGGALAFLERHFFSQDGAVYREAAGGLEIVSAENKKAEIRQMAQRICDLLEEGYERADIGICFRDIGGYEKYIDDLFASYGIPCFVDQEISLLTHPVFQFGAGLLRIAAAKWSFASVFALLKSGLFPMAENDCDRLENYCLAHAVKGKRFYQAEDWTYCDEREGEDLAKINEVRRAVLALLLPAVEKVKQSKSAMEYCRALWEFLETCGVDSTVDLWRCHEEERGHWQKSTALAAGVGAFGDMLDQIVAAFPEGSFSVSSFLELLKMGAATVTVKTIPQELDAVEIYLLGMSRPPRKKVIFLGGVNEGVFPAAQGDGGFLNRNDRTLLKEQTALWVQDQSFFYESESILTYQALTLAKEKLIVSYLRRDGEEKVFPSPLIDGLKRLFPALRESVVNESSLNHGVFRSLDEVLSYLPVFLREGGDPGWEKIKEALLQSKQTAQRTQKILTSLDYTGQSGGLSPSTLAVYPGREIALSVSSVEMYRRCPFSYFARYGLRLKERKILQFTAPDLGNIFHEALSELLETMKEQKIPWQNLRQAGNALIGEMVENRLHRFAEGNLFPKEQLAYIGYVLGENLKFIVDMMASQAEQGDAFVPVMWEVPFGRDREIPSLDITVDEDGRKIRLNGVIDRVDMAEKDGKCYFRIIDYKSSDKELTMDEIYYGLKPQLPIYLMVLENGEKPDDSQKALPAGIFYQSLKDALVKETKLMTDTQIKEKLSEEMRLKGYIIGDGCSEQCFPQEKKAKVLTTAEHDRMLSHTHQQIKTIGKDIFQGKTEIRPYRRGLFKSCDICPYRAVCGYEPELMGREEQLPVLKEAAAKTMIGKEEAKEG